MSERQTKEITTKGGHKIVFKEWITGREKRQITDIFLRDIEMKQKGGEQEFVGLKGSVAAEAEEKAIEIVVISVDGKTEKVVDAVLDLPSNDYDEVNAAINEITQPEKKSESTS